MLSGLGPSEDVSFILALQFTAGFALVQSVNLISLTSGKDGMGWDVKVTGFSSIGGS